jgi:hypothetical protein
VWYSWLCTLSASDFWWPGWPCWLCWGCEEGHEVLLGFRAVCLLQQQLRASSTGCLKCLHWGSSLGENSSATSFCF